MEAECLIQSGDTTRVRKHLSEKKIPRDKPPKFSMRELLRPHWKALTIGLIAVTGEGIANLLEPWPFKSCAGQPFSREAGQGLAQSRSHKLRGQRQNGGPEVCVRRRSRHCRIERDLLLH